jgi:hypothetical protein
MYSGVAPGNAVTTSLRPDGLSIEEARMALPTLAVINFTTTLTDNEVRDAIEAVNRQVTEQFAPVWGCGRTLRSHVPNFDAADPDTLAEEPVPADSVLYLTDEQSLQNALGFHDLNTRDLPFGFVFVLDPHDWTTTLSHEALELMLDPTASVFVPGPDPRDATKTVLHSYEACDAVERFGYPIGGIQVSDFVTPSYFTPGEATGHQNDFLGVGVLSFGVTKDSHIGFFDLAAGEFVTFQGEETPVRRANQMRATRHEHPRPARDEARIAEILESYQSRPLRTGASGLPHLRGVTRKARYAGASRSTGMMRNARTRTTPEKPPRSRSVGQ